MKYLKKIFENKLELDTEYIDMCFIDFIEESLADPSHCVNEECEISILFPNKPNVESYSKNLDTLKKYHNDFSNFLLKVEEGVNKVKIEYPNIDISYSVIFGDVDISGNPYNKYSLLVKFNNQLI